MLEINKTPHVKAYSYHSYLDAIISTEENTGDLKAEIYLEEGSNQQWNTTSNEADIIWDGDICKYYASQYANNTETYFSRECKEYDEITMQVRFFQNLNSNAIINMFISRDNVEECIANNQQIFRFSNIKKYGFIASQDNVYLNLEMDRSNSNIYQWMKMVKNGQMVYCFLSVNGELWDQVCSIEMETDSHIKYQIGINTNFGEHQYYNWFFSNYIQICYDRNHNIKLDYYIINSKNYSFQQVNQFLDCKSIEYEEVNTLQIKILDYIEKMLILNFYIEVYLDEFYIPERTAYKKFHHVHQNLIYGIERKKKINIMGYGDYGKIVFHQIDKGIFEKGYANLLNEKKRIRLIKYNLNYQSYTLDIELIKNEISEYLHSYNSSKKMQHILPAMDAVFGLEVYKNFLDNEDALEQLMKDRRITYLIKEHKEIMKERIEYLRHKGYLKQEDFEELMKDMNEIVNVASVLMSATIKNLMTYKKGNNEDSFRKLLKSLMEKETRCYQELLDKLE